MQHFNTTRLSNQPSRSLAVVKEYFSLRDINYELDIRDLILEIKKMRTAQKVFFSSKGKQNSQQLLLNAKRAELELESKCNQLWQKYRLSLKPKSK